MKTIWKFPIKIQGEFEIEMPGGATILCVQVQNEKPCIWALCEPFRFMAKRKFCVIGTGHPIHQDESLVYIGTFQLEGGALVFHLFEKMN